MGSRLDGGGADTTRTLARTREEVIVWKAVNVDPDVAITGLFCFEVVLVALGGGYLVRLEMRRPPTVETRTAVATADGAGGEIQGRPQMR
jgi:hypothetical protein